MQAKECGAPQRGQGVRKAGARGRKPREIGGISDAVALSPCPPGLSSPKLRPAPNKRNIRIIEKARMLKHSQQVYNPAINIQLSSFQSASCLRLSAGNECPNTSPRSAHMPQCCDSGTPNTASIRIALCIDCRNTKKLHVSVQLFSFW